MRIHIGKLKYPMDLITAYKGYTYIDENNHSSFINKPFVKHRVIKYLFGVSTKTSFFGFMSFNLPVKSLTNETP